MTELSTTTQDVQATVVNSVAFVINERAGKGTTATQLSQKAAEIWPNLSIVKIVPGEDLKGKLWQAIAKGARLIIVAGGDGTINTVVNLIMSHKLSAKLVLGIIPFGTLNHLARDLKLPLDPLVALNFSQTGSPQKIDVASVNGHYFVNTSSLGIYTRMLGYREKHRGKIGVWPSLILASWLAFRHPIPIHVQTEIEGKKHTFRTLLLFVGNNDHELAAINLGKRHTLTAATLNLLILRDHSLWGFLRILAGVLRGNILDGLELFSYHSTDFSIRTRRSQVHVACDGERLLLPSPLHYKIHPLALNVIAPEPPEQETPVKIEENR